MWMSPLYKQSPYDVLCVVPFPCNFLLGLSLALRSHDQFKASLSPIRGIFSYRKLLKTPLGGHVRIVSPNYFWCLSNVGETRHLILSLQNIYTKMLNTMGNSLLWAPKLIHQKTKTCAHSLDSLPKNYIAHITHQTPHIIITPFLKA